MLQVQNSSSLLDHIRITENSEYEAAEHQHPISSLHYLKVSWKQWLDSPIGQWGLFQVKYWFCCSFKWALRLFGHWAIWITCQNPEFYLLFVLFWPHLAAQGLLLTDLTLWDAGDRIWVSSVQGNTLLAVLLLWTQENHFVIMNAVCPFCGQHDSFSLFLLLLNRSLLCWSWSIFPMSSLLASTALKMCSITPTKSCSLQAALWCQMTEY